MSGMSHLTEEEIAESKEAFSLFDKDGSGQVPICELGNVLHALALEPCTADEVGGRAFFDFDFLVNTIVRQMGVTIVDEDMILALFDSADKDGSGSVTVKELVDVLRERGETWSEFEVEELTLALDPDGKGRVLREQFMNHHCGLKPAKR
jgi:calmodulin